MDEHPDADHEVFQGKPFEPGRTMDSTGTWNIPTVVLASLAEFLTPEGERPGLRFWLVEGHQRRCYLHALAHRSDEATAHDVFVLSLRAG